MEAFLLKNKIYFNVLDDIVKKYNNTVHRTIKMKPIDVTSDSYAEYNEDFNEKDPKFKVGDYVRFQNKEDVFTKGHAQNWTKYIFIVSKIKNKVPWTYVISDLNDEEITWSFYEKEFQKIYKKKLSKKTPQKVICSTVRLTKKDLNKNPSYKNEPILSKPFRNFQGNINVKVNLSNYATIPDIKNVTRVDTSGFALKTNLASFKTTVDQLDIDKLMPVPVGLSKLSDAVKNDVAKKAAYDKLVAKVNNIDISGFVLKTKYQTDKTELEKKIPDITDLVNKTKLTEL